MADSEDISVVAIPWYEDEDTYQEVRSAAADSEVFSDSYDEWLATAKEVEHHMQDKALTVYRVPITLTAFAEWCAKNGRQQNGSARAEYASHEAARRSMNRE